MLAFPALVGWGWGWVWAGGGGGVNLRGRCGSISMSLSSTSRFRFFFFFLRSSTIDLRGSRDDLAEDDRAGLDVSECKEAASLGSSTSGIVGVTTCVIAGLLLK
jgi:hypothetical protein